MSTRSLWLLVFPAIAVMAVAGTTFHLVAKPQAKASAEAQLAATAHLIAGIVEAQVERGDRFLRTVLEPIATKTPPGDSDATPGLVRRRVNRVREAIDLIASAEANLHRLEVCRPDGELLLSVDRSADRSTRNEGREGLWARDRVRDDASAVQATLLSGQRFAVYRVLRDDRGGQPIAVARAVYGLGHLRQLAESHGHDPLRDGAIRITDRNGRVFFQLHNIPRPMNLLEGRAALKAPLGYVTVGRRESDALHLFYDAEQLLFSIMVALTALLIGASILGAHLHGRHLLEHTRRLKATQQLLKRQNLLLESRNAELAAHERELAEARDAAENAARVKSEFLANMSHEIRTPMTAILGFADALLGEAVEQKAPPRCIDALETIHRNGKYLLTLINDILDLSKIEAGRMELESVSVSLVEIVLDVVSVMHVRAEEKGLFLRVVWDGPVPETIRCDPLRLRQILFNLVGNALKFTEEGGVTITVALDEPDDPETAGRWPEVRFAIDDTGIGLTREQRRRIFDAFSQADTSTTRTYGGSGLGLAISARLAKLLNGSIIVDSDPGVGSTFTLTIPTGSLEGVPRITPKTALTPARCTESKQQPASAKDDAEQRLSGRRILLAEDGPDNQRIISFILQRAGADVEIAADGQQAMEEALRAVDADQPYDVILMDMQMPVMDGYDATGALRSAGYDRPIVALTAHAMAGDREQCLRAGCDDYATKPIDIPALIEKVALWCERSTVAS